MTASAEKEEAKALPEIFRQDEQTSRTRWETCDWPNKVVYVKVYRSQVINGFMFPYAFIQRGFFLQPNEAPPVGDS